MPRQDVPIGSEVGTLYDEVESFSETFSSGSNLHFGYWTGPEDSSSFAEAQDRLTDLMTQRVPLTSQGRFLDVGCGVGGPSVRYVRATGAHLTGVTVSAQQVAACRELARQEGLAERTEFHLADATRRLPFDDASFDAAWALESLPHMDRGAVLREISRLLRPGARLALTDILRAQERSAEFDAALNEVREQWKVTLVTEGELRSVLDSAGFDVVELLDIHANTARSGDMLAEQLREAYGDEVMDQLPQARDVPGTYVMVTARKR